MKTYNKPSTDLNQGGQSKIIKSIKATTSVDLVAEFTQKKKVKPAGYYKRKNGKGAPKP